MSSEEKTDPAVYESLPGDALRRYADEIERLPHENYDPYASSSGSTPITSFNLGTYGCGSVACIAGYVAYAAARIRHVYGSDTVMEVARATLGLAFEQAARLFVPASVIRCLSWVTPKQAASVMRDLAARIDAAHPCERDKVMPDWSTVRAELEKWQ